MALLLSYQQKIFILKHKNEKNREKIYDIFFTSLEKYKKYLTFIKQEEKKSKNESEVINSKICIVENINKIKIKYKINEKNNNIENEDTINKKKIYNTKVINNKIKIFGESFVQINKEKCYIVYNGKNYNLNSYFDNKNKKIIIIELIGII